MTHTTEEERVGGALPAAPRTPALRRCLEVAQALAYGEGGPVELVHLFISVTSDSESATRSRLVMRATGAHHFVTDDTYRTVAEAAAEPDARTRAVSFAPAAAGVLSRLEYWTTRTGDDTADTAHLLLACLETGADDKEMRRTARTMGLTERVALSHAMMVRHEITAADRQSNHRGPILSRRRSDRPVPYHFEAPHRAIGPRKGRSISLRSQMSSAAHVASHLQSHLIRWHVWVLGWQQLSIFVALLVMLWASLTVTWWSTLWVIGLMARRQIVSPALRLGIDVALVIASVLLGIPWPLVGLALVYRVLDLLDGRLALLEIRGDAGDPSLTESALRSDLKADRSAANFYRTLKITGRLTPE
ncbi:hypothetical protein OG426_37815 [Streptomyces canus]|uniref:hypothetical protein n=1 Tax=Streptomyces canus TaxID=58343 RepID=UPI00225523DA|nr:hypothetical protein [Streptomyces canus]MCX4856813.1 hypothetical protein [Streptomyces canus]WSW37798.1 hypothetical protein OG426_37815 [Streptomyces canus]